MKQPFFKLVVASFVILIVFGSSSISAAHYEFSHKGFNEGGIITGSFEGEDVFGFDYSKGNDANAPDGKIIQCYGRGCGEGGLIDFSDEVTNFNINFSGNPFFESLNFMVAGLEWLSYDLSTRYLELYYGYPTTTGGDSRGDLSYSSEDHNVVLQYHDDSGWHRVESGTTESIQVTQTPLPAALNLFLMGIIVLFVTVRHLNYREVD